ncbi:MAG TPA: hypothetical protein VEL07_22335 [Planctomycetota bacterium]|nr:hypothetical protein [Planctomycetota bacterium]
MTTSRPLFRTSFTPIAPIARGLGRVGRRLVESVVTAWDLVGSDQMRNLLLAVGLVLAVWLAQRIERCERGLARIAEAQGVMGYATMRQLEAMGLGPKPGGDAPAASPRAVDPATLDAHAAPPGEAPIAAPAHPDRR